MVEQQAVLDGSTHSPDWRQVEEWDRTYYLHAVQNFAREPWEAVESAEGNYLQMSDGRRLLDFVSQASSDHMGHRDPRVVEAIHTALERYGHVMYSLGTDYRAKAAKLIVDDLLGQDGWAGRLRLFVTGSEAVESALTMARMVTGRSLILSQRDSFHGHTGGSPSMLKALSNRLTRSATQEVRAVPGFPPEYIRPIPRPDPQDFDASNGLPSITETAKIIEEVGPENVAAVITETFSGGGLWMGHDEYLPQLRELTQQHGILWIDDEVVCGFGRLGRWFSYQLYPDIRPDIMVIGKGPTGGILPCGGVVTDKAIGDYFENGNWQSRTTWDGHPLVAAAICANVEAMIADDVVSRAEAAGKLLQVGLDEVAQRHRAVAKVTGIGLAYAVEVVGADGQQLVRQDRDFDYTGDLDAVPSTVIARAMARRGVLIAGGLPNTVKLTPPLRITRQEIDTGLAALDGALADFEDGAV